MSKYVYRLDPDRPNNTAAAIYQAARRGGPRVLDVGSGPGIIASFLATRDGKDVTCVDYDAEALDSAREQGVATTHVVDLRDDAWHKPLAGSTYDVVVLADVLEHLVDPERVLRDLREQHLVADDGHLVVSIPNANHEANIVELATGHFTYTETGLLDRTHLRFFTLDSITALLESCGFFVDEIHRTTVKFEDTRNRYRALEVSPALRTAIDELGLQARTFQYVLLVRPAVERARLAELSGRLDAAATSVYEAQQAVEKAQKRQGDATTAHGYVTHDNKKLTEENARLAAEVASLKAQLRELRGSATWKTGQKVRRLARPVIQARAKLR